MRLSRSPPIHHCPKSVHLQKQRLSRRHQLGQVSKSNRSPVNASRCQGSAWSPKQCLSLRQPVRALKFPGLSRDLEALALTGRPAAGSHSYHPWTQFMAQAPLGSEAGCVHPVHWLSLSEKSDVATVIIRFIPEEAQLLMSIVRKHGTPSYILTYAAPATRKRLHFNNLNYYSIPDLPHNWVAPLWAEGAAWDLGRRLVLGVGRV
ncbi:hypothetical protein PoMZ_07166 [Pyricularia oryzae]|uniref:Uncharacterized protein n=1 Tax=Pyricularia oryzae TaxID=318829 RepID=A0A4V1C6K7_PYROR|nr:hypothetical protein PoMZ_07166 [Pyricularia oryzae]